MLSLRSVSLANRCIRTVLTLGLAALCASAPAFGQRQFSGETKLRFALDELNNLGSVLMIAAHPDDENTALLAYLARGRHVRTGYLSLTRGEGGQNLIGSEQSDELGIIRTEELLAARRIDGAEQYFTRAIDFGFTKTAEETLGAKWPREKVLGDVVWAIRRFRPDVIILRFSGTPRDGHGQHQASAILGNEAFAAAADPKRFPEQLKYVKTWQTQRLMTNVAAFNREQQRDIDKIPDKMELDLGEYSPELGFSYNEIAGMSRSQHRSQAMGTAERKGPVRNYFVTENGDKARTDIFEGINIGWSRVDGGAQVTALLEEAKKAYEPAHPEKLVQLLTKLRPVMAAAAASSQNPLAEQKLKHLDETIAEAAGLWVDAAADKGSVVPGGSVKVTLTALARNPVEGQTMIVGAKITGIDGAPTLPVASMVLARNKPIEFPATVKFPENAAYSQPYWLEQPKDASMYSVPDARKIGDPENDPVLSAEFRVKIAGTDLTLTRPVVNRYVDRVYGELTRPLAVIPAVGIDFGGRAVVFADDKPRRIDVPVKSASGKVSGELRLTTPNGWKVSPDSQKFELGGTNEQTVVAFDLTPPAGESRGALAAIATVNGRSIAANTRVIDYPHIPVQTLFPAANSNLVRVALKNLSRNVGYVMGAGDEVPDALRQMGCDVTLLTKDDLLFGDLSRYDAIVTGVRAWNVRADLRGNYQRLYKYAENGGTVVVQYNVAEGVAPIGGPATNPPTNPPTPPAAANAQANTVPAPASDAPPPIVPAGDPTLLDHIGPYPIKESRDNKDRVTMEEAAVKFPNPDLIVLNSPNEITARDFEGWIQERGLNFAIDWDPRYKTVFESHDPGDKEMFGGELFTPYGKGAYVFTAYSWFRQLPAGVPGAYRLFANMLSAGKALNAAQAGR
ncbi:MAG: PIG-L family deacetylase [Bryobacteraceae bacterium]